MDQNQILKAFRNDLAAIYQAAKEGCLDLGDAGQVLEAYHNWLA